MVILSVEGTAMLQVGNNQYLQPDYLSPFPTTLDAKKSPLALLAQTCSQIGADPGSISVKTIVSPSEKGKKTSSLNSNSIASSSCSNSSASSQVDPASHSSRSGSPTVKIEKSDASPEIKLAFKPYEINVLATKVNLGKTNSVDDRPSSKMSSGSDCLNNNSVSQIDNNNHGEGGRKEGLDLSPRGSIGSPVSGRGRDNISVKSNESASAGSIGDNGGKKCSTPDANLRASCSVAPNYRDKMSDGHENITAGVHGSFDVPSSGIIVVHKEHPAQLASAVAYKPNVYGITTTALPSPPGIDQTNPAFRPPFVGSFSHHHAVMLAAVGYSGAASTAGANPYLGYSRVKTPSGGETLVPLCKDPYCTGCQISAHNHQLILGSQCPAGCTQCDHQKYMAMALNSMQSVGYPGYPPTSSAPIPTSNGGPQSPGAASRPYMCNWMVGDSYCGKRCNTTDELLSHLRTHTSNLSDPAALALQQQIMPLSAVFPPPSLHPHHRSYSNPPLSPLSSTRYHPYVKPTPIPTGLPVSPYNTAATSAAFNPAVFGQYYSPYAAALYGQRIGAAVHQ